MDEVRVERLVQKYKESGELDSEDPALLMLKKWPVSKQCKDNSEKLPGLEQQVNRYTFSCREQQLIFYFFSFSNSIIYHFT